MIGRHLQLNGHGFEQTLGDSEGQGSLVCCSLWGRKGSRHNLATEQQQQMESRRIVLMNQFAGQQWRCRYREQICEYSTGRKEWDEPRIAWKHIHYGM